MKLHRREEIRQRLTPERRERLDAQVANDLAAMKPEPQPDDIAAWARGEMLPPGHPWGPEPDAPPLFGLDRSHLISRFTAPMARRSFVGRVAEFLRIVFAGMSEAWFVAKYK